MKDSLPHRAFLLCVACVLLCQPIALRAQGRPPWANHAGAEPPSGPERELFEAANRERSAEELPLLQWDPALAAAARKHVLRMSEERLLEHQYPREDSLRDRVAGAGARFSLVAENIAVAHDAEAIHMAWMHSPGHRGNILDPNLTSIGIATVERRGYLFAAQDFARAVETLTIEEQEKRVAALLAASGFKATIGAEDARRTCTSTSSHPPKPGAFYRFETADLSKLPDALAARLASLGPRTAAVGACPPREASGFARYRLAILFF